MLERFLNNSSSDNDRDPLRAALTLAKLVRSATLSYATPHQKPRGSSIGAREKRKGGQGHQFWQFRDYTQGDTPRSIDWRRTGRGDTTIVRERADEQTDIFRLWVDPKLGSISSQKHYASQIIALTAAHLAHEEEDKTSLLRTGKNIASRGQKTLQDHAHTLQRNGCIGAKRLKTISVPRADFPLLISDFWVPLESFEANILPVIKHHPKGLCIQVAARDELDFPFVGRVRFSPDDTHANNLIIEDTQAVRTAYLSEIENHINGLRSQIETYGWGFMTVNADADLLPVLQDIFAIMSTREVV
ncbi:MAG: hypothetical protein CMH25_05620 [Micavibrio sp.]|nr:hypothetical protein [Micavibrio sp.]|tara:strand:- start:194566 stop:195471 length:906 start_codon:yes stop_codon:yes gene_type:complete